MYLPLPICWWIMNWSVMLIYDKSGRELHHRMLSFFVVEIMTIQESVAKLNLQMVISPQHRKIIKFSGLFSSTFIIDRHNQTNSLSISKCRRYILANAWPKIKILSSGGQIFFSFILCLWNVDFWKADEKTVSVICRFAYFLFVVFLWVQSSKSCPEGWILMEPPDMIFARGTASFIFTSTTYLALLDWFDWLVNIQWTPVCFQWTPVFENQCETGVYWNEISVHWFDWLVNFQWTPVLKINVNRYTSSWKSVWTD